MEARKGMMTSDGRVSYGEEGRSYFIEDNPKYEVDEDVHEMMHMIPFEEFEVIVADGPDGMEVHLFMEEDGTGTDTSAKKKKK